MNPVIMAATAQKAKENAPVIIKGLILLLLVFFAIKFGKEIYKALKSDTSSESEKDVDKSNLSKSQSWYSQSADSLKEAMYGIGTDEETIYSILKQLNNIDDWNYLIAKFGMYAGDDWLGNEHSLPEWLHSELDRSEIAIVREILAKIGVTSV